MTAKSKYDDVAEDLMKRFDAPGVVLVMLGGSRGVGGVSKVSLLDMPVAVEVLRTMANDMEADFIKRTTGELIAKGGPE